MYNSLARPRADELQAKTSQDCIQSGWTSSKWPKRPSTAPDLALGRPTSSGFRLKGFCRLDRLACSRLFGPYVAKGFLENMSQMAPLVKMLNRNGSMAPDSVALQVPGPASSIAPAASAKDCRFKALKKPLPLLNKGPKLRGGTIKTR